MSDPFIPRHEDGEPAKPAIPAGRIEPHVTSWKTGKLILVLMVVFAAAIGLSGAGTLLAISHSDKQTRTSDSRNAQRNQQISQLVGQLQTAQGQIRTLANKVAANQARTTSVLCTAVITGIKQAKAAGRAEPNEQQTIAFLRQYGCVIPPGL